MTYKVTIIEKGITKYFYTKAKDWNDAAYNAICATEDANPDCVRSIEKADGRIINGSD